MVVPVAFVLISRHPIQFLLRLPSILCLCVVMPLPQAVLDSSPAPVPTPNADCDVEKILEARELPPGSMVSAGTYGGLTEVSTVFVPQTLEQGKYEVTVSRESDNMYLIDGEGLYLKTSTCMEYATMEKAILEVADSQYGFGTLYFLD